MKRIGYGFFGVAVAFAAAMMSATGAATAAVPAGVSCAGSFCYNSTSEPQTVTGTEICPNGPQYTVSGLIPPNGVGALAVLACPNGVQPQGILY